MKVTGIPKEFKAFFNRFRDLFSKRQIFYFSVYVYGLLVMPKEKKNVTQIAKAWAEPLCRSSLERLLCEAQWEFTKVLKRARTQVLRKLSHQSNGKRKRRRTATLVLDDTTLKKFGSQIFGVGWFKKRKDELPFLGLQLVVVGILIDDWLVPLDMRIYLKQDLCKLLSMSFETKLTMAQKMLKKLKLPHDFNVELMFDSWYLSSQVTGQAEANGWHWYSRARSNRKAKWEDEELSWKKSKRLNQYVQTIEWKKLEYKTKRKNPALVGHQRIGELRNVGRAKLVISSLESDGSDKWAFFCSNHTKVPMVELIKKFERRWKIEVYFRESRAHLALQKWYFRDVASVVHHLCLSIVAMIACFCIRVAQVKPGENLGTLGEFIEEVKKQNQRAILYWFFEQRHLEKLTPEEEIKFNELCASIDL